MTHVGRSRSTVTCWQCIKGGFAAPDGEQRTENGTRGKRATDEAAVKTKPLNFQTSTKTARIGKPQISQIWSRLRACYRTQDCQNDWKSQRTRRTTKKHKGRRCRGRAGRARKAYVRLRGL